MANHLTRTQSLTGHQSPFGWSDHKVRTGDPTEVEAKGEWHLQGSVDSCGVSSVCVVVCLSTDVIALTRSQTDPDTMLLLCEVYAVFTLVTVTVFAWLGRSYDPRTWALVGFLPGLFAPWFVDTQGFAWQVVGAGKVKPSLIHWPLEDATVMVDIGSGNGLVPSGTAITWSNVDPDLQLSPFGITRPQWLDIHAWLKDCT